MNWCPRAFKCGESYVANLPSYGNHMNRTECIRLVIGPCERLDNYKIPIYYRYLDLITGEISEFHRDSYFAEQAEIL